jgi:hypothetical protein
MKRNTKSLCFLEKKYESLANMYYPLQGWLFTYDPFWEPPQMKVQSHESFDNMLSMLVL